MSEGPPRPGGGAATINLRFPDLDLLRRTCDEQLRRGSLFVATTESLPPGSPAEIVLGVGTLEAVLRVTGKVLPPLPGERLAGLRIAIEDAAAATQAAESYLAVAEAVLADDPPPLEERRGQPRVSTRVRVRLRFEDAEQFRDLYTKDISAGGLFVLSKDPRPPETPVEVVLLPPGLEDGFALNGVVTHTVTPADDPRRSGMGVRFDDIPAELRRRVEDYIRTIVGVPPKYEPAPPPEEIEATPYVPPAPQPPPQAPTPPPPEPPFAAPAPDMERRQDVRVQAHVQVKLRPTDLRRFRELYTRDISRGGVFVYTDHPLPRGTEVEVLLYAPGSRGAFSFMGEVMRIVTPAEVRQPGDLPGMGIRFHGVDPKAREVIEGIISRVLDDEPLGPDEPPRLPQPPPHPYTEPTPEPEPAPPPPQQVRPATAAERPAARAPQPRPGPRAAPLAPEPPSPRAPPPRTPEPLLEPEQEGPTAVPGGAGKGTWVQQRRDPRYPGRVQTLLRFSSIEDFREAYTRDISRGGVFLATADVRPLRSHLEVVLMPPGSPGISLTGEVVHVVGRDLARPEIEPGMGIQFLDLTPEKKAAVEACLNAVAEQIFSNPPPVWSEAAPPEPEPVAARRGRPASTPQPDLAFQVVELQDAIPSDQEVPEEPPSAPPPEPPPHARRPTVPQQRPQGARVGAPAPAGKPSPEEEKLDRLLDEAFMDTPGEPVAFDQIEVEHQGSKKRPPAAAPPRPRPRPGVGAPTMPGGPPPRGKRSSAPPARAPQPEPPAPPEVRPLGTEQARAILEDLLSNFRQRNYYDALGVKANASFAEINHAIEIRMRPLLTTSYPGGIEYDAEEVLQVARQHFEAIRGVLSDPERRAAYECSIGIFSRVEESEDPELAAARVRVRQQFREKFAREFPDKVRKAEEFFRAALEDLRSGDQGGALRHAKMAITFDPLNDRYHELMRKLQPGKY